jgi:hypothetical protein
MCGSLESRGQAARRMGADWRVVIKQRKFYVMEEN